MRASAEYAEFLKTTFWKELSLRVRKKFGFRCQRCGKEDHCQAHHKFYREDWNQTQEDDLECICLECHEKEHGINVTVNVSVTVAPPMTGIPAGSERWTSKMVIDARSKGQISREVFKKLIKTAKRFKKHGRKYKSKAKPNLKNSVYHFNTQRPRWVNRGGTSN